MGGKLADGIPSQERCQVLHVTNKRNIIKASCNIHGHNLEKTDTAKYLGVNIHHKLCWNHHNQKVTSKANSTRAFLQRNIHQCPHETKVLCYKTLLRPVIEYASIILDLHTNANINILEMVQRRYARFVLHDYRRSSSVTAMFDHLHWASLQERRAQAKVELMFRIVNGLVDIPTLFLTPTLMMRGHSQRNILFHLLELPSTSTHFPQMVLGSGMLCHSSLSTAPPWTVSEGRCSPSSSANCRLRFNAP